MTQPITIKLATEADCAKIRELAELDASPAPRGEVLVAEIDGRPWAAIGEDGNVVADPFRPTAELVELLRARLGGRPVRAERSAGVLGRLLLAS